MLVHRHVIEAALEYVSSWCPSKDGLVIGAKSVSDPAYLIIGDVRLSLNIPQYSEVKTDVHIACDVVCRAKKVQSLFCRLSTTRLWTMQMSQCKSILSWFTAHDTVWTEACSVFQNRTTHYLTRKIGSPWNCSYLLAIMCGSSYSLHSMTFDQFVLQLVFGLLHVSVVCSCSSIQVYRKLLTCNLAMPHRRLLCPKTMILSCVLK